MHVVTLDRVAEIVATAPLIVAATTAASSSHIPLVSFQSHNCPCQAAPSFRPVSMWVAPVSAEYVVPGSPGRADSKNTNVISANVDAPAAYVSVAGVGIAPAIVNVTSTAAPSLSNVIPV